MYHRKIQNRTQQHTLLWWNGRHRGLKILCFERGGSSPPSSTSWRDGRNTYHTPRSDVLIKGSRMPSVQMLYRGRRSKSIKLASGLVNLPPGEASIYIGDWRNGSAADFDSVGRSSTLLSPASPLTRQRFI